MFGEGFWVALAFVVFVAAIYRPVGRMLSSALDARGEKIRDELEEAVRLREQAQALLASYQRQQNEAAAEAEQILSQARDEAEREAKHAADAVKEALDRRKQLAMDRIARAEEEALAEVRGVAVDIAVRATREVLSARLRGKRGAELIDEAIADLDEKLH